MLSFLFPRIRSVVAKPRVLRHLTDDADAGDWRIQICFPGRYFAQLENTTRRPDGPENFFTWMRDYFGVKKTIVGFLLPAARIRNGWLQSFLPRYKNWMFPVKT